MLARLYVVALSELRLHAIVRRSFGTGDHFYVKTPSAGLRLQYTATDGHDGPPLRRFLPPHCCAKNCRSASLKAAGFWWVMRCVAWGMTTRRLPGIHRTRISLPKDE